MKIFPYSTSWLDVSAKKEKLIMLSQIEKPVSATRSTVIPLRIHPIGRDEVNNVSLWVGDNQVLYLYQDEPDRLIGTFPLNEQIIQALAPIRQKHPTISGVYCHECMQMVAAPQVQHHPCKGMSAS
jgi:hypothetical protein